MNLHEKFNPARGNIALSNRCKITSRCYSIQYTTSEWLRSPIDLLIWEGTFNVLVLVSVGCERWDNCTWLWIYSSIIILVLFLSCHPIPSFVFALLIWTWCGRRLKKSHIYCFFHLFFVFKGTPNITALHTIHADTRMYLLILAKLNKISYCHLIV